GSREIAEEHLQRAVIFESLSFLAAGPLQLFGADSLTEGLKSFGMTLCFAALQSFSQHGPKICSGRPACPFQASWFSSRSRWRKSETARLNSGGQSCPASNVAVWTATPAAWRRCTSDASFSAVYHSSRNPRPISTVGMRASVGVSSSGGTSPPQAITPLTGRAMLVAARNAMATPCEKPDSTSVRSTAHSRDTASMTPATYAQLS